MESDFVAWSAVLLRFVHVLAAIMWIGNSLLFTWMELNLIKPAKEGDLLGTLDMLHGGGVFHLQKLVLHPGRIPVPLHWFMWQSYTTWISGFLLLVTLYINGGGTFFLDGSKSSMTGAMGIVASLAGIFGGWVIYDLIWRSPIRKKPSMGVPLSLGLLFLAAYLYSTIFNGRAVYLQIGAMMGTMMSANVFFHIIANQRKFMAALESGREHDVELGKAAKFRSLHNHFMTFPVLFLMLSAHFPGLYSAQWSVAILAVIVVTLMVIKYLMNSRYWFREWLHAGVGTFLLSLSIIYVLLVLPAAFQPAESRDPAELGRRLMTSQGCAACHMQGSHDLAPDLHGVFGTMQHFTDGTQTLADAAYIRESILNPSARVVKGYAAVMPPYEGRLSEEQINQLVAYIESIGR